MIALTLGAVAEFKLRMVDVRPAADRALLVHEAGVDVLPDVFRLQGLSDTLGGGVVIVSLQSILFWAGIHGPNVVGGVVGNMLMRPLSGHVIWLYIIGAIAATVFEYLVGILMQRTLHEVWWDYHEKPFNYKGIICLESTVAWGFYAIIIVKFLNERMMSVVSRVPFDIARRICWCVILYYFFDFSYHLLEAMGYDLKAQREKLKDFFRFSD